MVDSIKAMIGTLLLKLYTFICIQFLKQYYRDLKKLRESLSILIRIKYQVGIPDVNISKDVFIYNIASYFLEINPLPKTLSLNEIQEMERIKDDLSKEEYFIYLRKLRYKIGYLYAKFQIDIYKFFNNEERVSQETINCIVNQKKLESLNCSTNLEIKDYSKLIKEIKKIQNLLKSEFLCATLNKENKYISHLFEHSSKWLIVFLTFSVIASAFFEWGFFYYFKISISNVPYTVNDLIGIILNWSSRVALAAFLALGYFLFYYRISRGKKPDELMKLYGPIKKWFFLPPVMYFAFIIIMFYLSFLYLTGGNIGLSNYQNLVLASIAWLILTQWVFYYYTIRIRVPLFVNFLITYIPIFCLYFFLLGDCSAKIITMAPNKTISIQSENNNEIVTGKIIKIISKGYYLLDEHNNVNFYIFENVKKMTLINSISPPKQ